MNIKLSCFLRRCFGEASKAGLFAGLVILAFAVIVIWIWRAIYGQEDGLEEDTNEVPVVRGGTDGHGEGRKRKWGSILRMWPKL